jgi:hypothetical protein
MHKKVTRQKGWLIFFSLLMVFLGGCSYQWLASPSGTKIAIPLFSNETFEYGLEETLTKSIREEFILDGRLEITEEEEADLILQGNITHYFNEPLSEAAVAMEEYRVRIDILVSLISVKDGKTIWEESLGAITSYSSMEMIQTEDEAARETGKKIGQELIELVDSIVEG